MPRRPATWEHRKRTSSMTFGGGWMIQHREREEGCLEEGLILLSSTPTELDDTPNSDLEVSLTKVCPRGTDVAPICIRKT